MKKILVLILFLSPFFPGVAQQKQLTVQDAMLKARASLAPQSLPLLQFMYGTEDYVYLKREANGASWYTGNTGLKEEKVLLTLEGLNESLKKAGKDVLPQMPFVEFNKGKNWIIYINGAAVAYDPAKNTFIPELAASLLDKDKLEKGNAGFAAYLQDFNLFVSDGTSAKQVTTDGNKDIVYASSVHRDEFGISKGTFWSNNGQQLAFYRMDQGMVTDYPIIDWTSYPAKNVNIKYPMAGGKSHQVTVGVYHTATQKVVYLKTGEPAEQYLTNITWSPDDRFIYLAIVNRGQNHMKLNVYDAASGNLVKTLFEEKDDKYVEPLVPVLFLKNDPAKFIWQSNRDGWNHLYLYDTKGKLLKQLTKGNWEVLEVMDFDAKGEHLFYVSTEESPVNRNVYSLNINTGKSVRLTKGAGVHRVQISTSGRTLIDNFSTTENPGTVSVFETAGSGKKQLLQSANPLNEYGKVNSGIFTLKSKSGDLLYCNLYKAEGLDTTKKHPVIVYWYGGSHAQLVLNQWNGGAGDYWFRYMAQQGYIVFVMDTRGSDNRGKAFEQSMFRRAGDVQMEDMVTGTDYLKGLPYADSSRMGLFGWSFGGFNTVDFMLNHPDVFKAAVAGGPVTNWKFYEVMYTERYMDTPQENPEGYAATDLTMQIQKLKGKLLLIHGLQDNVVVQQHSVELVKKAVDHGVQVDYMIYPGHEHNVTGKDRAHLYQKVTDYFMQNLK
ncbi:DPP IV N-terminal domain-containing protein [Pedobacter sp. AW31-3R]|uniref:S9 family peptidase n=1 Tax=Pedobacter sp. AW31-3R TaxID=3445781 RepID=UPI003F9F678F